MSRKDTCKPKHNSVTNAELAASPERSKDAMNFSKRLLALCKVSYTYVFRETKHFDKKQFKVLESEATELLHKVTNSENTELDDIIILAQIYYNICEIHIESDAKRKQRMVAKNVQHCLTLLTNKELNCKSILLAVNANNILGYIYWRQEKTEEAIQIYDKAVKLYLAYMQKKDEYGTPIDLRHIVTTSCGKECGYTKLSNTYILLLRALVSLHTTTKPTDNEDLITCNHMLLTAEFNKSPEAKDHFEWIKTAMSSCNYFLVHDRFIEAKHYLNIATFVKNNFIEKNCQNDPSKPRLSSKVLSIWKSTFKLLLIHWAKYGIALLRVTAQRSQRLEKNEDLKTDYTEPQSPAESPERASRKLLLFTEIGEKFSIPSYCAMKM
ncbi:uncharacterized protein LOC105183062 isoform X2 [Harpegnathos saltator]|uniref:uncharacterized protein LOC105183062 isoform X2 n=1 Tax=Harpegnathos saltator TaxID=610380 RepID=UPI00058F17F4|nr:uncharacterized protein LOC105183062 isoform X2 [Harpegnathos saltator]